MTKQYGILAFPAKQSLSPSFYNASFEKLNLNSKFNFYEIPADEFDKFMHKIKTEPIFGLSVSLPYKQLVMKYMDIIGEDAKKIRAVNTVVNDNGVLNGYNTDFIGSMKALEKVVGNLKGRNAVILGAGGASRAVIYGLLKAGANVIGILNRTKETAESLAKEFSEMFNVKIAADSLCNLAGNLPFKNALKNSDSVLIQTTSIWMMNPDLTPAEIEAFCPKEYVDLFSIVMDIVYKPKITPILETALKLNKKIVTGSMMFIAQAIEQFKLIVGVEPPEEVVKTFELQ